ncbi:MAG: type II toxin-antitoxin system HicA family toxin [Planctomycetaceae bacterium]
MSKLPAVSARDAVRAFKQMGFVEDHQTGSHLILKKEGHEFLLSVPMHSGRNLKRGTLNGLIKAAGCTRDEFIAGL